jgi:hydrogenase 3 maturation protease
MRDLRKELANRLKRAKRVAILGVGSEFRGDDAAGMLVAEALSRYARRTTHDARRAGRLQVFYGATAPENLTGEIIRYKPSHIVIVDTADIKVRPGNVVLLDAKDLGEGVSFSTHKLPPKVMIDYLKKRLKCGIMVIGIQPKRISFGKTVSREVRNSATGVSRAILKAVRGR